MAIRIEVYAVNDAKAREWGAEACALRFKIQLGLDCDPDAACLAAGAVARNLGPMYAGDWIKVVAYVNDERRAQFVERVGRKGGAPEALAQFFECCKPRHWADFVRWNGRAAA